jgi:hypothetical protein
LTNQSAGLRTGWCTWRDQTSEWRELQLTGLQPTSRLNPHLPVLPCGLAARACVGLSNKKQQNVECAQQLIMLVCVGCSRCAIGSMQHANSIKSMLRSSSPWSQAIRYRAEQQHDAGLNFAVHAGLARTSQASRTLSCVPLSASWVMKTPTMVLSSCPTSASCACCSTSLRSG